MTLDEAKARLDKKYWTSSYDEIYGRVVGVEDFGNTDILNFRKMSELECSWILTEEAKSSLDHWIEMKE